MRLRIGGLWVLAGLVCIGAFFGGGRTATAGRVSGISISSGSITPVGDPYYDYQFNIVLGAEGTLSYGGYITVYDFPLGTGTLTSQPGDWTETIQDIGITPSGASITDNASLENVTWKYTGLTDIVNSSANPLSLGTFSIGPTADVISPGPPITIHYASTLTNGGSVSGQGAITIYVVPEPSSLVLLLGASGIVPILVLLQRRQRNSSRIGQAG